MKIKREDLILIFIFLFGVFIRILLFRNEVFIGNDAVSLTRLGKNLVENGRYAFGENYNWGIFFPPGYPLLVGIINLFINNLFVSGKLISLFSSIITMPLFYLIGKELYNKESGLFAAFVYTIHPSILETSVLVTTEALFFCLLFLSVYLFMISIRKSNLFIYALLGISIGMAYLTRPEGLFLLLLPFLSVVGCSPLKNKKHLLRVCITFVIFILIVLPNILFLKSETGKFQLSGKSSYLAVLLEAGEDVAKSDIKYDKTVYSLTEDKTRIRGLNVSKEASIVGFIIKEPLEFLKGYVRNSKEAIGILLKLLTLIILPLFLSFFYKDLFKKKNNWALLLFSFLFFAIYPSFFILLRHTFPTVLFLVLFSSIGFVHSSSVISDLRDFYKIKKGKIASFLEKNIKYIIIILCILGSVRVTFITDIFSKREVPVEHIKAAYFLKNSVSSEYEKLNIMHRVPWVSFYSDSRFTMLPYAHYTDVINFAKLYNVDYIVVDERVLNEWDSYDELINMEKYSDDVELIYEDNSEKLIKLFKVRY